MSDFAGRDLRLQSALHRLLAVKNFIPVLSVEGFEKATDARRGKGTYQKVIRAMLHEVDAHSTDLQSPESADHLCDKCMPYAENWRPTADALWSCGGCAGCNGCAGENK